METSAHNLRNLFEQRWGCRPSSADIEALREHRPLADAGGTQPTRRSGRARRHSSCAGDRRRRRLGRGGRPAQPDAAPGAVAAGFDAFRVQAPARGFLTMLERRWPPGEVVATHSHHTPPTLVGYKARCRDDGGWRYAAPVAGRPLRQRWPPRRGCRSLPPGSWPTGRPQTLVVGGRRRRRLLDVASPGARPRPAGYQACRRASWAVDAGVGDRARSRAAVPG